METMAIVLRLGLAAVFLVAGSRKVLDKASTRRALLDFGVPEKLTAPVLIGLPTAELATGAALIPSATARWGAVAALTLLLLFSAMIGVNLLRGRRPDCGCFGNLRKGRIGWRTLVRNAVLAGLAVLILHGGQPGVIARGFRANVPLDPGAAMAIAGGALLLTLVLVQGWLLSHVLRQNGRLLARMETIEASFSGGGASRPDPAVAEPAELPVGTPAPHFTATTSDGRTLTLESLTSAGKPVLLLFADPECAPCHALLPDVTRWQRDHIDALTVVIVTRGDRNGMQLNGALRDLVNVLFESGREVSAAFRAGGTPAAVLIGRDRRIASRVARGARAIGGLVARATSPTRTRLRAIAPARETAAVSPPGALEASWISLNPAAPPT